MGPSFKGGVATPHHKKATEHLAIERAPVPERLVVPMSQHLGAPCEPLVAKSDRVERGQPVGDVEAFISAPVHSPVAGTVVEITDTLTPAGTRSRAVVIEPDEGQELERFVAVPEEEDRVARVRAAGVVGMGGAMFPSSVKLKPPREFTLETVIVNGCECEPFLTCDHRTMVELPERVTAGARLVADITGASSVVIGVEDNKPDAVEALRTHAGSDIDVVALKTKYPQGAEKQLIRAVTGRKVPSGALPMAVGVLVQNVGTAAAIWDAVAAGTPLVERTVAVTGPAVREPKNLRVRVGTPIRHLLEFCGGLGDDAGMVLLGGPMMGLAQHDLEVPVIKGTSGVLCLPRSMVRTAPSGPCINCGRCVNACPMGLSPTTIRTFIDHGLVAEADHWDALDCIECGCCSYVCPAWIPLVQSIRYAKGEVMRRRRT
jgi:electron transport complex protein RnfC